MAADFVFKIIIVGEPGVGKSCLLRRFADQTFTENYINTIGVDFKVRSVDVNGKLVKLNIWDSAGQERFRTIVNTYYRGAHGICVVYDITDVESFEKLDSWLNDVSELAEPNAKKLILGTKVDLEPRRRVNKESVDKYAESKNINHVETSSKSGRNVEAAFLQMTKMLLEEIDENLLVQHNDTVKLGGKTTDLSNPEEQKKRKKCC